MITVDTVGWVIHVMPERAAGILCFGAGRHYAHFAVADAKAAPQAGDRVSFTLTKIGDVSHASNVELRGRPQGLGIG